MKKQKLILGAATSILVALLSVLLFWLCGYNFDHRGPDVGFAAFMALVICAGAGAFAAGYSE